MNEGCLFSPKNHESDFYPDSLGVKIYFGNKLLPLSR
jgi:hypothetical protein